MIKVVIFDFFGVLEQNGLANGPLFAYIETNLKPKYKLGIISNSSGNWLNEILSKSQAELFDDVVLSYQAGVAKPEAAIYGMSLENLAIRAEEAIFVDDIEEFCEAARSVGMKAVRYIDFDQMKTDLETLLN